MPNIHIHLFETGRLISSVLCNERSIETAPPRLSLFIALHSVAGHYNMSTSQEHGTSSQFFRGSPILHMDRFDRCTTNKEKINYACSILNKPNIFEV